MPEHFYQLVASRQSDRGYLDTPVERPKIQRIMEAARLAPSACNAQPWKFIVVDDPELTKQVAGTTLLSGTEMNRFAVQAPVLIVVVMKVANLTSELSSRVKRKHFPLIDIGIAAEHICLAATAEGLGSCMIGWFDEPAVLKLLHIPRHNRPVLIITLGYRSHHNLRQKRRNPLEKIVSYNEW
jgi:nitroreductase